MDHAAGHRDAHDPSLAGGMRAAPFGATHASIPPVMPLSVTSSTLPAASVSLARKRTPAAVVRTRASHINTASSQATPVVQGAVVQGPVVQQHTRVHGGPAAGSGARVAQSLPAEQDDGVSNLLPPALVCLPGVALLLYLCGNFLSVTLVVGFMSMYLFDLVGAREGCVQHAPCSCRTCS